ncbi:MAG: hypothetical protein AB8C84_07740 [Oligoflexales bacterium]
MKFFSPQDIIFDKDRRLKKLGGHNLIIHCHHYNARLQNTIWNNTAIHGKHIWKSSAKIVFSDLLRNLKKEKNIHNNLSFIQMAEELYCFLGFGTLNIHDKFDSEATSENSHYVKGWSCGSLKREGCVCAFTESFIESVYHLLEKNITCTEQKCMNEDHQIFCLFQIKNNSIYESQENLSSYKVDKKLCDLDCEQTSNIDKETIITAVSEMPIIGGEQGLIPAFNVYLANMPQDFYNLLSIRFIDELNKIGLADIGAQMLYEDAEHCALNTFGGILHSDEWAGLIAPMVQKDEDIIHGLIAVSNALGWGIIHILNHTAGKSLTLQSNNSYESFGYLKLKGHSSHQPRCFMLSGVSAGLMALVYEKGEFEDRVGLYHGSETQCSAADNNLCLFQVKE